MNPKFIFFFILLGTGLWSCSPKTSSSLSREGLSRYRTYAWLDGGQRPANPIYSGEFIDQNIRGSVDRELRAKGFVQNAENPDFYVNYHTYTERRTNVSGGGMPYYYGGWYRGWSSPSYSNSTIGTLVIDFIDAETNKVIWRGHAEGDVDNAKKLPGRIDKGVHSILKKLPS